MYYYIKGYESKNIYKILTDYLYGGVTGRPETSFPRSGTPGPLMVLLIDRPRNTLSLA